MKLLFIVATVMACMLFVAVQAQAKEFPPPPPLEEPAAPGIPRLAPPPPQIPPPAPLGRPVAAPVEPLPRPNVVKTIPETGISLAEPALREIRVTFDQDMDTRAFAFSGDIYYPSVTGTAIWLDSRTCSLPVALAPGRFYRVGVNLPPLENFQAASGAKANPYILYFTTLGAKPLDVAALKPPRIVSLRPDMNAHGVTPGMMNLTVVFDQKMLKEISFVVLDRHKFPEFVGVGTWSADMRQLTFPARLQAQEEYLIGLNSPEQIIFQNDHGVPLFPIRWAFDTIR